MTTPAPNQSSEEPSKKGPRRRWRTLRGAGIVLAAGLLLLAALVVFLQTEAGRARVRAIAVSQVQNLLEDDVTFSIDRLDGNFLTGARLLGVRIEKSGRPLVEIDTMRARYRLLPLLKRTFSADLIEVSGLRVAGHQREDGSLDLAELLKEEEESPEGEGAPFTIQIDSFQLSNGELSITYWPPDADSTLRVDSLDLDASHFFSGADSLSATLNRLAFDATAPHNAATVAFSTAGAFSPSTLSFSDLQITSHAGSNVTGSGDIGFRDGRLPALDADFAATPLELSDIRAFLGTPVQGAPTIRLTSSSNERGSSFELESSLGEARATLLGSLLDDPGAKGMTYSLEGNLSNLNPSELIVDQSLDAILNGSLNVELQGDSLQALNGPFSFSLSESRVANQPIEAFQLLGNVTDGQATFDLSSTLPGARLTANGALSPFDDVPSWRVDGHLNELNLARLTGNPSLNAAAVGSFSLNARGASLETLTGTAGARIDQARYNDARLANSRIDVEFQSGTADFETAVQLSGGGSLQASGHAAFAEDPLRYTIEQGRFDHLNLETITGDSTHASDLTGRFSLEGRDLDPQSLLATGTFRLNNSRFGTHDINRLATNYRLDRGRFTFNATGDLAQAGAVTAQGTAYPFSDPLTADIEGTTQNLNLAALTSNAAQPSDLSGRYSARLRGLDPQTLSLNTHLELEPSSYGSQVVDGGTFDLNLNAGNLTLTGDLQTPEGMLAVDVSGRPFDDSPTLSLGDRTCFRGLDLRVLTGNPDLQTNLNGCLRGRISGLDPQTATIDALLSLQPSRVADAEIEGGQASIDVSDGYLRTDATLAFSGGETNARNATISLTGRPFDEEPHLTGEVRAQHLNLAEFSPLLPSASLPQSDLTFSLDSLVLRGTTPETMTLRARLAADGSRIGEIHIDTLQSTFRLEEGIVTVDTSRMRSNLADATGEGTIALFDSTASTDYSLEGQFNDVSLLSSVFANAPTISADQGQFSLRMQGVPGHPFAIEGILKADNVVYGDSAEFTAQQLTSEITGEITPNLDRILVQGQTQFQDFLLPGMALPLQQGDLLLAYDNETGLTFQVNGRLDEARKISMAAAINRTPAGTVLDLNAINLTLGSEDWYLARHAEIEVGDAIRINNLLLRTGDGSQQFAVDGRLDFSGEQRLIVTAENVDIRPFTDLFPARGTFQVAGLGGTLWATLFLRGPAENPELLTFLSVENLSSKDTPFGSLLSRVNYRDERLTIDADFTHQSGHTLTINGHLPQHLSLAGGEAELEEGEVPGNVNLVVHSDAFPLAWAKPFLNPEQYSDIGGLLSTDSLTVTGTYDNLNLTGNLSLTDGLLGVTTTGVTFQPLEADLRFSDNRIILDDVHITDPRSGERQLEVTGDITLENLNLGRLDLTIRPNGLLAMNNQTYRRLVLSEGSRPLQLTGTLDAPRLSGGLTLDGADILMSDELRAPHFETVQLTPTQIRDVETLFGQLVTAGDTSTVTFIDALDYDLDIEINRNVWLRSRAGMPFDIEFEGTIDAHKRPFAEGNQLFGTINLVRGWVQMPGIPGKRFALEEGTITLNGEPLAALMDLSATLETRLKRGSGQAPITITMAMTGRFNENPEIRLTSNPALDAADIISVIATGQLSQDIGGAAATEFASGYALGQLSGLVEGAASQALGLDMVELNVESNGTVVIRLGKYLTERAFASVGYRLGNNDQNAFQNQSGVVVGLDYELLKWLMLQAEQGGRRGTGAGLGYEFNW